jgi:3-methylcrotonyl-CoA carboxylase alpha subunit
MITSLLIANRGEIACRVIRTARAMGIRTVAVYSDADAKALHVRQADEAVHIGPSPAAESYLVGDRIIEAAKAAGAEAIHPGYGFLSENAKFAQDVLDAGLIWVGPRPDSIRAMGLKDAAKKLMLQAGVPVTPGYMGDDQSPERLLAEAEKIGWPVLIKAVAGGGGKGMRKVDAAQQFVDMLESCRREARASFGNDEVLLEKWITSPRHIEVQVFGDTHGNVVHLFERDCSLQRRHQKVIEEAPAPGMDEATREAICAAAVRAAKAVDYVGAGTIEFIADASQGLSAERIFFMEMNTRLQVEHPVTEQITGVDLVEWQLRVASGEPLPKRQDQLNINGHAIEARLYAEDPAKGFLPSTGKLEHFVLPRELKPQVYIGERTGSLETSHYAGQLRLDTGYEEGDEISPFYDPMIAKLIFHGEDRLAASLGMMRMVGGVETWPVKTNAPMLHMALVLPDFTRARVTTSFVDDNLDDLMAEDEAPSAHSLAQAAELLLSPEIPAGLIGLRLNAPAQSKVRLLGDGKELVGDLEFEPQEGAEHYLFATKHDDAVFVSSFGRTHKIEVARMRGAPGPSTADGAILAPMPGKVIAVDVAQGDTVIEGQRLLVLEAMKMEHALTAPFAGTVAELTVAQGQQVEVEALLARVERTPD